MPCLPAKTSGPVASAVYWIQNAALTAYNSVGLIALTYAHTYLGDKMNQLRVEEAFRESYQGNDDSAN